MPGDSVEERTINEIKTSSNSFINKATAKLSTRLANNKIPKFHADQLYHKPALAAHLSSPYQGICAVATFRSRRRIWMKVSAGPLSYWPMVVLAWRPQMAAGLLNRKLAKRDYTLQKWTCYRSMKSIRILTRVVTIQGQMFYSLKSIVSVKMY
jgi:hypothetical protein